MAAACSGCAARTPRIGSAKALVSVAAAGRPCGLVAPGSVLACLETRRRAPTLHARSARRASPNDRGTPMARLRRRFTASRNRSLVLYKRLAREPRKQWTFFKATHVGSGLPVALEPLGERSAQ